MPKSDLEEFPARSGTHGAAEFRPPDWPGLTSRDRKAYEYSCAAAEPYAASPEATPSVGGLRGTLEHHHIADSIVYPGVSHEVTVFVPPKEGSDVPSDLIVFLDGSQYLAPEVGAAAILDNLIAVGDIAPTVGVFLDPGPAGPGLPIYGGADNRSVEYDSVGDRFAAFLHDEILDPLEGRLPITSDPSRRIICGASSGGSAAFTVAWERPDSFANVISHCGSYVNIRGARQYPDLIRRSPAKPIRVMLQTGRRDLNIVFGDWLLANREMASALEYAGYEFDFIVGEGGHSLAHGAHLLPDCLRWFRARNCATNETNTSENGNSSRAALGSGWS